MSKTPYNLREEVCDKIITNLDKVNDWFHEKTKNKIIPFYSSFDIRDSGFKIGCVDANMFPAGFNNICDADKQRSSLLIEKYFKAHYPSARSILLLTEEHTKNLYYWDNVFVIQSLIQGAGYKVTVCVPGHLIRSPQKITTASGREVSIHLLEKEQGDVIVSNNDFSVAYDFSEGLPLNPCLEMGWRSRKKHNFFLEYNKLVEEFSSLIGIDPWYFKVETEFFAPFDIESEDNRVLLKEKVSHFFNRLKQQKPSHVKEEPYVFLKNNSGTYGLGITNLDTADELDHLTYKVRKKMKASKGGGGIQELIIQEGIPTVLEEKKGRSVEPVIYMIGSNLTGGFLRGHDKKGYKANLNSPGCVFRTLCLSDLEIEVKGHVMENVYGWIGKLGSLAIVSEIENRHLDFGGYRRV